MDDIKGFRETDMSHSGNLQSLPMSCHSGYAKAYAMLPRVDCFLRGTNAGNPYMKSLHGLTQVCFFLAPNVL